MTLADRIGMPGHWGRWRYGTDRAGQGQTFSCAICLPFRTGVVGIDEEVDERVSMNRDFS
jgi:hypothetical protein